jgi:ubiquinone/menaquinone biosynthesis C-methylase UbiE
MMTTKGGSKMFDEKAPTYDGWYQTRLGAFVDEVETKLAFDMFSPEPGMNILDVGCGTGNFSIKLAQKGCKVTGIDISEKMLEIAKHKVKEHGFEIDFHKMDIYKLDFPDNHFDAVFSMAAFEFIHDLEAAYSELMRVLKPGGLLLIGTIHKNSGWGKRYLESAKRSDSIFRFADFKNLEDLLELDKDNLLKSGECLFIPPDAKEDEISWEEEKRLYSVNRGGFICALWEKPNK